MKIVIISLVFMLLAFLLFSVRLLFVKNGEFKGTCANNNPMLQDAGAVCGVCGRKAGEACEESEK
ncbi:hypothetical protein LAG90_14225 [Marinilongibacter aquaticus]|uniref:hypothetical protein n=1 Tax=Marinilongibacter aquaticus TaxID=2975157 RepID=UPI0021BD447E|nr:hypothetical protein [Marinilongibacter aquaticus]UBM57962.1 hypothetical protein LAG90_14225 [Marinilongibacter aquaticus]